jgi:hypothetical protein
MVPAPAARNRLEGAALALDTVAAGKPTAAAAVSSSARSRVAREHPTSSAIWAVVRTPPSRSVRACCSFAAQTGCPFPSF